MDSMLDEIPPNGRGPRDEIDTTKSPNLHWKDEPSPNCSQESDPVSVLDHNLFIRSAIWVVLAGTELILNPILDLKREVF